jgi:hypothetical protein
MLKEELPAFLVMGTKFIDPLFHSFYFMQLNIFYMWVGASRPLLFTRSAAQADPLATRRQPRQDAREAPDVH